MRTVSALSVLLAVAASGNVGAQTAGPEHLSYEDFLEKVRADEVKSLTLGPWQYMKGTYSEGDTEKEFFSQRTLEAASDTLLTELLEKHEVPPLTHEQELELDEIMQEATSELAEG